MKSVQILLYCRRLLPLLWSWTLPPSVVLSCHQERERYDTQKHNHGIVCYSLASNFIVSLCICVQRTCCGGKHGIISLTPTLLPHHRIYLLVGISQTSSRTKRRRRGTTLLPPPPQHVTNQSIKFGYPWYMLSDVLWLSMSHSFNA